MVPKTDADAIYVNYFESDKYHAIGPREFQIACAAFRVHEHWSKKYPDSGLGLLHFVQSAVWYARNERINARQKRALWGAVAVLAVLGCQGLFAERMGLVLSGLVGTAILPLVWGFVWHLRDR